MLGFKEMNFASFELKTIKFIKILKANFQQNIHRRSKLKLQLESMLVSLKFFKKIILGTRLKVQRTNTHLNNTI